MSSSLRASTTPSGPPYPAPRCSHSAVVSERIYGATVHLRPALDPRAGRRFPMVVALVVGLALAVIVAYCLVWTRYRCRAALAEPVEATWGLDDVQVRIVTVGDAPETVRETVETLPAGFGTPVGSRRRRSRYPARRFGWFPRRTRPPAPLTKRERWSGHGRTSAATRGTSCTSTRTPTSPTSRGFRTRTSSSFAVAPARPTPPSSSSRRCTAPGSSGRSWGSARSRSTPRAAASRSAAPWRTPSPGTA